MEIPLNNSIYVGGCLPLAAIVYMDFVDFTKASQQQNINYGVPRMAHVQNEDFDYLTSVDLNTASKKPFALGFFPLRDISRTPYSACVIVLAEEKWSKAPQNIHNEKNVFPNYNDILDVASTSTNTLEVLKIISQVVAKHDEMWKKFHEQHVQNMFAELKAIVMSLQLNSNSQLNNIGTSTRNPIVLLSAGSNRNNLNEPVHTNNCSIQAISEPVGGSLFEDHLGVSPRPLVTFSQTNNNIQVQIPTGVPKQVPVSQQAQETEEAPSVVNIGINSKIKEAPSPVNNGTVSEPGQKKNKLKMPISHHQCHS